MEANINIPTFRVPLESEEHPDLYLVCTRCCGWTQVLMPASKRRQLVRLIHRVSHPGIRATKALVLKQAVWPGLGRDVADYLQHCHQCLRGKVVRHTKAPLKLFDEIDSRFSHVHMDVVGSLPEARGTDTYSPLWIVSLGG